jgi:hypothetical protein
MKYLILFLYILLVVAMVAPWVIASWRLYSNIEKTKKFYKVLDKPAKPC